jgi:hypothetical protein
MHFWLHRQQVAHQLWAIPRASFVETIRLVQVRGAG